MREIKFRAWDAVIKLMHYQDDFEHHSELEALRCLLQKAGTYFLPLMQFTGLLDKNGKEIYEGDWLCGEDGLPGNVYFDSDHLAWFVDFGGDFEINPLADLGIEYFEVTGNIYENPELLEAK
jgi:hypothetical protein